MKTVFATFSFTSLIWCLAALWCFTSGKVERHTPDYVEAMAAAAPAVTAKPVKLARN